MPLQVLLLAVGSLVASPSVSAEKVRVATEFDARGQVLRKSQPHKSGDPVRWTEFRHDGLDRQIQQTHPGGSLVQFRHVGGDIFAAVETIDEMGHRSVTQFDAFGREVFRDRFDGGARMRTTYAYDVLGRLTAIRDANNAGWVFNHDGHGNQTAAYDPDLGCREMSYDLASRLVERRNADGGLISFDYDALGRVAAKTVDASAMQFPNCADVPIVWPGPDDSTIIYGTSGADTITGGNSDQKIFGLEGNDTLRGGPGKDEVSGGPGDDVIYYDNGDINKIPGTNNARDMGGPGVDTLIIEAGSRYLTGGLSWYGFERFQGAEMDDTVHGNDPSIDYWMDGGAGNDVLKGHDGDDTLRGGPGSDEISGGAGNDIIYYDNSDINKVPGTNNARDMGGPGVDTLIIEAGSRYQTGGLSWYGFERFQGADQDDTVHGNNPSVDYWMDGGAGNDVLKGHDGNDTLRGGPGSDEISGGAGNDIIYYDNSDINKIPGTNNARDMGGPGVDTLIIEAGSRYQTGGLSWYGFERFQGAELDDSVVGNGSVSYTLNGGAGNDELTGGSGNDTINGEDGNDTLRGGAGKDSISGGAGNDIVYYQNGDINKIPGTNNARDMGGPGVDTLIIEAGSHYRTGGLSWYGFERFQGADKDDIVHGNNPSIDYWMDGGAGNDFLKGHDGDDTLRGGPGSDEIYGGAGNDILYYEAGDNFWNDGIARDVGGPGTDKLIIEPGSHFNTDGLSWYGIESFQGAEKNDRVVGNSGSVNYWMHGGGGNDYLKGNNGNDTLRGGPGADEIYGGGGNDVIYFETGDNFWDNGIARDVGGPGTDKLVIENGSHFSTNGLSWYGFEIFQGADKNDSVVGNNHAINYWLYGAGANDKLTGANGNDTLIGGSGSDTLTGRGGADVFVFTSSSGTDRIKDFQNGTDVIRIDTGASKFSDLSIRDLGPDVEIRFSSVTIILEAFDTVNVDASDFRF